ncbi:MAG: hypothetical protein PF637_06360 [Spirochaetes bacterium]|jgi:hypothetical protein|nr:hypothetical protein [Spirochaetota bacterium]
MVDFVITTRCGSDYGSGHFWRMTTLLNLLLKANYSVHLYSDLFPDNFPDSLRPFTSRNLPAARHLIHDMRDSDETGAQKLSHQFGTITTIDDAGFTSLYKQSIKLLPSDTEVLLPTNGSFPFLYGYHFHQAVCILDSIPEKNIDLLVYTGFNSRDYPISFEQLQKSYTIAWFNGTSCTINGKTDRSYSFHDLLFRSKLFLSHFGLSLYEAALAGAHVVALNPSPYHSALADNEKRIALINTGTFDADKEKASKLIHQLVGSNSSSDFEAPDLSPEHLHQKVATQHSLFLEKLLS